MKILTALQMGDVDRRTTEKYKIPSILLMENAGRSVAEEIQKEYKGTSKNKRVVILCGRGNNGGDGLVVARYLALHGDRPEVLLFADPAHLKGDALANWQMVAALGIPTRILVTPAGAKSCLQETQHPDVVVDALFGTGLSKPVGKDLSFAIDWINRHSSGSLIVAVDIPSGLFADSPQVPGPAVRAHVTVTFTALKLAHVMPPASDFVGRVKVVPIGSPQSLLDDPEYRMDQIDSDLVQQAIPQRSRESHKGTYGHVFVVAGSRGKSGAALMTGLGALRSGAGLVTLWLPETLQREVTGKVPELMAESLPETADGNLDEVGVEKVLSRLQDADALVVGPGVTTAQTTRRLVHALVARSGVPVIIDADGINAFASHPGDLSNQEGQPVVITPHPGEMARLIGKEIPEVQKDRLAAARTCSADFGCFTILKGYQTIVAAPSGHVLINNTGNPGMATGGSGDILAGMVGCLAAVWKRKSPAEDHKELIIHLGAAVYLHGLAGDLAAKEMGMESMIATDLLPHLPEAFKRTLDRRR